MLLDHPRGARGQLVPQYRPGPPPPDPREARRLVYRMRGWPEHLIDAELARLEREAESGDRPADSPAGP